ncbi:MAG: serine/threonine-protein kinase PknK [Gammaproteobacteria bacterium]
MIKLPGYQLGEKLSEGEYTEIYRGKRTADNVKVVLKFLKVNHRPLEKLTGLQSEYESLNSLKQLNAVTRFQHENEVMQSLNQDGAPTVYGIEKCQDSLVMISSDGGQDLQRYLKTQTRLSLTDALSLTILIVESLDKIHQHHIIHKNINPANIVVDFVKNKVEIIDFDIATSLSKESLEIVSLNNIEGSAAYLSPEQTGRMNRGIDYRSDYYSLGVTFYQLFTGVLPFQNSDPIELVQAHISKQPIAPNELNPAIPISISKIILKLLAKNAEDRYQSAFGLIFDLKQCMIQTQQSGTITNFEPGQKDFSGRFQIPEKLYGRQQEIKFLLDTFERVNQGHSELMLVAGHAGIGKSSLVHEVRKPMVEKRGYFIAGKFDQLKRNIPYDPIIQALDGLIQQLLTEDDNKITVWRERILKALGTNSGVITEVLPSLERIIGKQPPPLVLAPTETQNRFIVVFQSFIQVLAAHEHPLVMFLDDLQWVDLPSLRLIKALISQPSIQYFLIIGAYRDNEVDATHPLMLTLESFKQLDITFETLHLMPLLIPHIQQLLADTMTQEESVVETLSTVCHAKTLGNPFFLNQFLRTLYDENLIRFDLQREFWHWEIDKIKSRVGTDNVIDLVVSNIQKLSPDARLLLKYAACLGHRFELKILATLYDKPLKYVADILLEVMQQDFILPLDEAYKFAGTDPAINASYVFLHDRVQQAAYSLLNQDEKKNLHLKIGRHLQQKLSTDKQEEMLFDIVNQLNLSVDLITNEKERIELAYLNLRVGKKVTASAAYPVALDYFHLGLQLLPKNAWETHYDLSLQLYTSAAEMAYLCDNFVESAQLGNEALTHARSLVDQVKVYQTKIYTEIARNAPATAVEISIEVLKKLGVKFPKKPNKIHVLLSILNTKLLLLGKSNEHLMNLLPMTDPIQLSACKILSATIAPAYYAVPALYPLVTLELLKLSIRYGYNSGAPVSYASYGIILCGVLNDIKRGNEFGQMALKLVEQHRAIESEVKVSLIVTALIAHWQEPYRNSLAPLLVAHLRGIETGDFDYSAYAAYFYIECAFYVGIDLSKVAEDTKKFYELCDSRHTHKPTLHSIKLLGQTIENLRGLSASDPCSLIGTYYEEKITFKEAVEIHNEFGIFNFYTYKTMLNFHFYNYEAAYEASLAAPAYIHSATASSSLRTLNLFESLTRLALCDNATSVQRKEHLKIVAKNQKKLKFWAKHAPMNTMAQHFLVEAEWARIHGQHDKLLVLYDKAIELAKDNESIQIQAMANELAGKFFLNSDKPDLAKKYLLEAYHCYNRWGAAAKVKHLISVYPDYLTLKM